MNHPDSDLTAAQEESREESSSPFTLPPLQEQKPSPEEPEKNQGVSPALKRTIILFTVFTALAFITFSIFFIRNIVFDKKDNQWDGEILALANKLNEAGLSDQALRQYENYLELPTLDMNHRAEVAYKAGSLYLSLNNCRDGLVLLYQAQIARPEAPWSGDLNGKIDACLAKIKTPPHQ